MQQVWLNQSGSPECILFLTGWGMDHHPFTPINSGEHDILMVYDYRKLHPLKLDQLDRFDQVHLVTWSMGVWVAAHLLREECARFKTRTAVSGTLDPVHPTMGIPPVAYQELEDNFSFDRLIGFHNSMFTDQDQADIFAANHPMRDLSEVHEELIAFRHHYEEHGTAPDIFTHKIVTSRDRVFPLKNQRRAWGEKESTTLKLPHFPFYSLPNWSAVIKVD